MDQEAINHHHGLPFMRTVHHRRFLILWTFEYFDHSTTETGVRIGPAEDALGWMADAQSKLARAWLQRELARSG
jgi:hypothetical protein